MKIKNNSSINKITEKSIVPIEKKSEKVIEHKNLLKIDTKDYLTIEPTNKSKVDIFKFVDTTSLFSVPEIKPVDSTKKEDIFKTSYDEKNKIATIESDEKELKTKTVINQESDFLTTELTKQYDNNQLKVTGGFNTKDSQLDALGIESNSKDTNIKFAFDSKKANLAGEVKQKIGNQNIKINSDFDYKKSGMNQLSIESSGTDTLVKASLNTQSNSLTTELNQKNSTGEYKLSGDYNLGESSINKLGVEYTNKGFKVNTDYNQTPTAQEIKINLTGHDLEFNSNFDVNNNFALKTVEVAKPILFGENLPTVKFSAGYDKEKNSLNKLGIDLTANIDKEISITYSTNLAESAQKHSMKLNYNLHNTTKLSVEGNLDGVNSGYSISISSGFKF